MSFDKNGPCTVHKFHRPRPLRIVTHHVQPREMGGADTDDNKVRVCDTGHFNIHRIMAVLHKQYLGIAKGPVPGTRAEKALAARGYSQWRADGQPGHFVFEDHPHLG
jgi:hypothetical protein